MIINKSLFFNFTIISVISYYVYYKIKNLENNNKFINNNIDKLTKKINKNTNNIYELNNNIDKNTTKINKLNNDINKNTNLINELNKSTDKNTDKINELTNKLTIQIDTKQIDTKQIDIKQNDDIIIIDDNDTELLDEYYDNIPCCNLKKWY